VEPDHGEHVLRRLPDVFLSADEATAALAMH
jgi:hypothetical protein